MTDQKFTGVMTRIREYRSGSVKIMTCFVPSYRDWVDSLLSELNNGRDQYSFSHHIGDRWENTYLDITHVPTVRLPMRLARDLVKENWRIPTVVLYEAMPNFINSNPPFWFNIAKIGERTGVHDHAKLASVSGVVYLQCSPNSGNLFFQSEEKTECSIVPEKGKMVLFPSHLRHGVSANESSDQRISLAFNLYPFPLPSDDW